MLCVGAWSSSGALSPRSPGLPSLRHRAQTSFIWLATDNSGKCMYSSVASSLEGTPSAKISRKADVEPPRKRRPEHDASPSMVHGGGKADRKASLHRGIFRSAGSVLVVGFLAVAFLVGCAVLEHPEPRRPVPAVFRLKASQARRVSVVGTFNGWDPQAHPLQGPDRTGCGAWGN